MSLLSGLGILLSLVFACLLLALVAELYYLLWWKKQRICRNGNRVGADYTNHTNKELFYLFCWDKPSSIINNPNSNTIVANPEANYHNDPDVEMGLASNKDMLLKALGEDGVESEIMRLHNLVGPPRFLFTINEETKEDLESDDGRSKGDRSRKGSRTRSLGDLVALENQNQSPFFSPLASPPLKVSSILLGSNNNNYDNPLFESSVEAELNRAGKRVVRFGYGSNYLQIIELCSGQSVVYTKLRGSSAAAAAAATASVRRCRIAWFEGRGVLVGHTRCYAYFPPEVLVAFGIDVLELAIVEMVED
ncbi:hypothetical protein Cgig2_003957 [Carnegiea gigantea]|uniref:Uncharacterized protein n=1 Tax=Carnegiea gigantea TaxID=171969 RepID=A0A9Q1QFQ3_9CARY|nr:hypothetical protein Cgig2_003957 [Carnegiea gigantea]